MVKRNLLVGGIFARYVHARTVDASFQPVLPEEPEALDASKSAVVRSRWAAKQGVLRSLVELFDKSAQIRNTSKLYRELLEREKKGTTALPGGIALPHVRSLQPRRPVICIARAPEGLDFFAEDDALTYLFFGIVAPPYHVDAYLKLYGWVSRHFKEDGWLFDALLEAEDEHEIVSIVRGLK